jgi:hypothetical protein
MKSRDSSNSNGYFGSPDMIEDLYIHSWYKIGDSIAKELGITVFIWHIITTRSKRIFLYIKRYLHYLKDKK